MNHLLILFSLCSVLMFLPLFSFAQDGEAPFEPLFGEEMIDDGDAYDLTYNDAGSSFRDYYIPPNTPYNSIVFTVRGGDGGGAISGGCESYGGDGAVTQVTVLIGDAPGQLPRGCYIRFIAGEAGDEDDVSTGTSFASGGGGGGSAVLFNLDGSSDGWEILAVAGGGGGAYQGNFLGACVDSQNGQGGRAGTSGGDGADITRGLGGEDGNGGEGGGDTEELAGGGGGAFSDGTGNNDLGGENGFPTGSNGGVAGTGMDGGWGFGGGGASFASGGGGGGYSGGGGGGIANNGGGGGSYANPDYSVIVEKTEGGRDPDFLNGYVKYRFRAVCARRFTGFSYINPLCAPDDRGRIQLDYVPIGLAGCVDEDFTFTLSPINGWNHLGGGLFRSMRAGTYVATVKNTTLNAVVDAYEFTVGVTDEAPTARCKNITVNLDDTGNYDNPNLADLINDGSSGPCDPVLSASQTTFDCTDLGRNPVTLSVTGSHGLTSTCTARVRVEYGNDSEVTARCAPAQTYDLNGGTVSLTNADIDGGSTISGCPVTGIPSQKVFDCTDLGENTVTLRVSQGLNISLCATTITITDNNQPTARCESDYQIVLAGGGTATLAPAELDGSSTSNNCTDLTFSASRTDFTCEDIGDVALVLTVTDGYGRTNSCQATVNVTEIGNPVALCKDITVGLNENGTYSLSAEEIDDGSNTGCVTSLISSVIAFGCDDLGEQVVTLTATSALNNQYTCQATVTVVDTIRPTAVCPDFTFTDLPKDLSLFRTQLGQNATDNCGIRGLQFLDDPYLDCDDIGVTEVRFEVRDGSFNRDTCTINVTVDFTFEEVVAGCDGESFTVELNDGGNYVLTEEDLFQYLRFSDGLGCRNFAELNPTASQEVFTCEHLGEAVPVTLTLNVPDQGVTSCVASINVRDNINPVCATAPQVKVKVFLAGVYETASGLMRDDLRALGLVPITSPYGDNVEKTSRSVLSTMGSDAIIDWVVLEIRSAGDPTQVVYSRSALLQRDGDVVDVDGVDPVFLPTVSAGDYYIAIRHRNHLAMMTQNTIFLD